MKCCPTCGRPMIDLRAGIALPRVKLRIFDVIKAAGEIGITTRDLLRDAYIGERQPRTIATVRTHIFQLNELLAGTDFEIATHDRRHWIMARQRRTYANAGGAM